ncbi:MAG: bifunctional [glutamate--ammonia ligase]-adenylyl-L-tyrosine phosphorylase/[glutamate--ammonia-ligase] adenylyltransferase, partial [Myxococcota bacterium]
MDLRLRPAGSAGPLSMSLARAERYYARFGRTWERAALMRATPVAGDLAFGRKLLDALGSFVWRRPVDPALGRAMHGMVIQSRRELRVDAENDVKLGVGGIRELEFFVQSLQLVWGGQHPELRVPGTMEALTRLARLGFVTAAEHDALAAAWALLRRVEHRVHMVAGYQTHVLPVGEEREDFARSLGFANAAGFDDALGRHRDTVHRLFQTLLEGTVEGAGPRGAGAVAPPAHETLLASLRRLGTGQRAGDLEAAVAAALEVHDAGEAASHLRRLARRPESPFGSVGAGRRPALAPRLLRELTHAADVDAALRHLTDFLVRSGPGHQARLLEEPRLARRLIALFGASPTLARALVGHPETLDALLLGSSAPSADHIRQEHAALGGDVPGALVAPPRVEVEGFVGALRRRKRELTLRIGLAHLGGELDDGAAQRLLTALADAQVRAAFAFARRELVRRRGAPQAGAAMVVVGMGKLGSGELGYGSDLDLTFLFRLPRGEDRALHAGTRGGTPPTHGELYTRGAQRTLSLLAQPDAEGPGFETDTRLRPSGNQGLLVVSDRAFARYHALHARGWERQALLKARVVAHDEAAFGEAMGALLRATAFRGPPEPARMAELRARMQRELAQERPERLHPKLGFGGLVDVELATQWLQMHERDPSVRQRHTLDALDAL